MPGAFYFRVYSPRTICPECLARVNLDTVNLGREFPCSSCGKDIGISPRYRLVMYLAAWFLGIAIPFLLGQRGWFLFLLWIPCTWIAIFLWAYIGKYLIPPRLVSNRLDPPSTLHLDGGPGKTGVGG